MADEIPVCWTALRIHTWLTVCTFKSDFREIRLVPSLVERNQLRQDRQYTYNVTLRRVQETIIAVEKQ